MRLSLALIILFISCGFADQTSSSATLWYKTTTTFPPKFNHSSELRIYRVAQDYLDQLSRRDITVIEVNREKEIYDVTAVLMAESIPISDGDYALLHTPSSSLLVATSEDNHNLINALSSN